MGWCVAKSNIVANIRKRKKHIMSPVTLPPMGADLSIFFANRKALRGNGHVWYSVQHWGSLKACS